MGFSNLVLWYCFNVMLRGIVGLFIMVVGATSCRIRDSIPSLGSRCACNARTCFCLFSNWRNSSLACVSSLAGNQEFSKSGYPFHLTRYCVLFQFLVGRDARICSISYGPFSLSTMSGGGRG